MNTCPNCGSLTMKLTTGLNSPHYGRLDCGDCGSFVKWMPHPNNLAEYAVRSRQIDEILPRTSGWENLFLRSVRDRRKLSPKQKQKFDEILKRHLREDAA